MQNNSLAQERYNICEVSKGFLSPYGYHGKSMMSKDLPAPGRAQEVRLKRLESSIGDLEAGQIVKTDDRGRVPPLQAQGR